MYEYVSTRVENEIENAERPRLLRPGRGAITSDIIAGVINTPKSN